jgi:MscS family membrane protein
MVSIGILVALVIITPLIFLLRSKRVLVGSILKGLRLPLVIALWFIGLSHIAQIYYPELDYGMFRQLVVILAATWFVIRSRHEIERRCDAARASGHPVPEQTQIQAIGKLITLIVLILAIATILSLFGVNFRALLTLGGLGTIAVGFAGKDVFSNFFSGFMLHITRPFQIGDYITSPDRPIDGVVEHIGWYLTRVMTLDKKPTYIPNSVFSEVSISNFARMRNRRIKETVGFRYSDLPRLAPFLEEVRSMLASHDDIVAKQPIYVRFTDYGDSSLNVLVQAVTHTSAWAEFLRIKEEVLLKIAEIADKHNVEFAFPTTTLDFPEKVNFSS